MPWINPPPEFEVWKAMRQRCLNPNNKDYKHYGGRGITVCARWSRYSNFIADMGRRPSSQHQLDRRDNNRGYSKSNCRWAVRKVNMRNTRSSVYVQFEGRKVTLAEAAELSGINYYTLSKRRARGLTSRTGLFRKCNLQTRKAF